MAGDARTPAHPRLGGSLVFSLCMLPEYRRYFSTRSILLFI